MRTKIAAGLLALAPLGVPSFQQTPPATAPATTPAANPAKSMEAPKPPPFAGEIVNFDRRGARVVACVDASRWTCRRAPGPTASRCRAVHASRARPPRLRIWVIEREVMQEPMTTGVLRSVVVAGREDVRGGRRPRRVHVHRAQLRAARAGGRAASGAAPGARRRANDDPAWSPSGGRIAFRSSAGGVSRVEVVDVKSAEVLLKREGPVKAVRWADERTLLVDATRVPVP
jgi:hypothetical protein